MLPLVHIMDYVGMLLIAAVLGAIGGVGWEFLQQRLHNSGSIELPGPAGEGRYYDLGWIASALLGSMAALALMYFFSPEIRTIVQQPDGSTITTSSYEIIKLIALSLLVGCGGSTILQSLQARVVAMLNAQRVETTATTAQQLLAQLGAEATRVTQTAIHDTITAYRVEAQTVQSAPGGADHLPGDRAESVRDAAVCDDQQKHLTAVVEGIVRVADAHAATILQHRVADAQALIATVARGSK